VTQPIEADKNAAGVEHTLARHGKIAYLRIPATEPLALGAFYATVFGWWVGDNPEHVSFRDTTGEVIGAFVPGLEISSKPGVLPFIYVEDINAIVASIVANGGAILQQPYLEEQLWIGTFQDPQGNVFGIWQSDLP
jgi:uncharacterized protein